MGANTTDSRSGGNRTHVIPLKRRAPRQHRSHFHNQLDAPSLAACRSEALLHGRYPDLAACRSEALLHGRYPDLAACRSEALLHGRYPDLAACRSEALLHGRYPDLAACRSEALLHGRSKQQVGEESNPAGRAVGFGNRVRSQTQSPPVNPVPRAGVEPDLCGLKDRRPQPEVQRGITNSRHQKRSRPGVTSTPGRRGCHCMARPGVTRSYRSDPLHDLTRCRSQASRRDTAPSQRPRRSSGEGHNSCAGGSWL